MTRFHVFRSAAVIIMLAGAVHAQSRSEQGRAATPSADARPADNPYAGQWTYRSYLNRPGVLVGGDPQTAIGLIFGEGIITLDPPVGSALRGAIDFGGGVGLDLNGTIASLPSAAPPVIYLTGTGRKGTPTDGWEYDYVGYLAYAWPNGIGQIPAMVGTVLRAKPHDQSPAGVVVSFIAVKQP
jgi:hypothetical protein